MAEGQPPHWDLDPMEAIFVIPKSPSPKLKTPEKWSKDFQDLLELCLKKDPQQRPQAKQLLCVKKLLNLKPLA
jgi:serine/threonine protein kinase